jgi:hypothetical protein
MLPSAANRISLSFECTLTSTVLTLALTCTVARGPAGVASAARHGPHGPPGVDTGVIIMGRQANRQLIN